ncbi:MAG: hypothetical protein ACRCXZ_00785 [Patescibacteria group bacterium]
MLVIHERRTVLLDTFLSPQVDRKRIEPKVMFPVFESLSEELGTLGNVEFGKRLNEVSLYNTFLTLEIEGEDKIRQLQLAKINIDYQNDCFEFYFITRSRRMTLFEEFMIKVYPKFENADDRTLRVYLYQNSNYPLPTNHEFKFVESLNRNFLPVTAFTFASRRI